MQKVDGEAEKNHLHPASSDTGGAEHGNICPQMRALSGGDAGGEGSMRVFGGGGCSARASTAVGGARGANCVRGGWYASNGEDGWGARVEAAHGRRRRWREGRGELLWMNGSLRREEEKKE